jgi:hypothetical protein
MMIVFGKGGKSLLIAFLDRNDNTLGISCLARGHHEFCSYFKAYPLQ